MCGIGIAEQGKPTVTTSGQATAIFAGGCFWCTEAVFEQIAGAYNWSVEEVQQIYVQATLTKMCLRYSQGEAMEKTLAWAEGECEGFMRS